MTTTTAPTAIERTILAELAQVAAESGHKLPADLGPQTPVFDSGLDSLGFAILVAKLEEELGFDPFAALAEPLYPATVGEFVSVYVQHAARHGVALPA